MWSFCLFVGTECWWKNRAGRPGWLQFRLRSRAHSLLWGWASCCAWSLLEILSFCLSHACLCVCALSQKKRKKERKTRQWHSSIAVLEYKEYLPCCNHFGVLDYWLESNIVTGTKWVFSYFPWVLGTDRWKGVCVYNLVCGIHRIASVILIRGSKNRW